MPAAPDDPQQTPKPAKRGPGRPSLGLEKEGHVLVQMQPSLKRKLKQTAAEQEVSANELVRRAVAHCCQPDELEKIFTRMHIDRMRKDRDEQRQKAKPGRRRTK